MRAGSIRRPRCGIRERTRRGQPPPAPGRAVAVQSHARCSGARRGVRASGPPEGGHYPWRLGGRHTGYRPASGPAPPPRTPGAAPRRQSEPWRTMPTMRPPWAGSEAGTDGMALREVRDRTAALSHRCASRRGSRAWSGTGAAPSPRTGARIRPSPEGRSHPARDRDCRAPRSEMTSSRARSTACEISRRRRSRDSSNSLNRPVARRIRQEYSEDSRLLVRCWSCRRSDTGPTHCSNASRAPSSVPTDHALIAAAIRPGASALP
jgi:hypothetical protein